MRQHLQGQPQKQVPSGGSDSSKQQQRAKGKGKGGAKEEIEEMDGKSSDVKGRAADTFKVCSEASQTGVRPLKV